MKLRKILKMYTSKFLDWVFPKRCFGCQKRDVLLCNKCQNNIAIAENVNDENIISIFCYKDPVIKRMLWKFKFGGMKIVAEKLAEIIYDYLLEELVDLKTFENFENPLIIPIPITTKKLRQRGFNQAELIAKELVCLDENNSFGFFLCKNNLFKIKETESQMSIKNRQRRLGNLKNCFDLKQPEKIHQRNVIIIDDILTTGATVREARKVLKRAGAQKILIITIAH